MNPRPINHETCGLPLCYNRCQGYLVWLVAFSKTCPFKLEKEKKHRTGFEPWTCSFARSPCPSATTRSTRARGRSGALSRTGRLRRRSQRRCRTLKRRWRQRRRWRREDWWRHRAGSRRRGWPTFTSRVWTMPWRWGTWRWRKRRNMLRLDLLNVKKGFWKRALRG